MTARDIRRGSLRANLVAGGQVPAGATGAQGLVGPPGPTLGESAKVENRQDIACVTENVVGEQVVTVTRPSRILAFANGALRDDGAATTTHGMWLRLRDAADTTVAVSSRAWYFDGSATPADVVMPLSVASVLGEGSGLPAPGAPYLARPGTYRLQSSRTPTRARRAAPPSPTWG